VGKVAAAAEARWALLALMAAGDVESDAARRGVDYLLSAPRTGDVWHEEYFNAVGFPRVFFLRYHGYCSYFPLWALARYRNLLYGNTKRPIYGI